MNYREFKIKSGKVVFCGKNEEQNEDLVRKFIGKENLLFHTIASGSPFCVLSDSEVSRADIKETATICARYSQDWRDNKKDIMVHFFKGEDVYKEKRMKTGTFGVKNSKRIKIKKEDVLKFEMIKSLGVMQIGKQGLTDNFFKTLEEHFKTCHNVKVSVLKSAGHDKNKVKELSLEIIERLGKNYTSKILGFTIFIKKWRKAPSK